MILEIHFMDPDGFACDYNHYDENAYQRLAPADFWTQNANGEWTPLCAPCLPDFWEGGDRELGPWVVYPIQNVPTGPLRLKRMDDR